MIFEKFWKKNKTCCTFIWYPRVVHCLLPKMIKNPGQVHKNDPSNIWNLPPLHYPDFFSAIKLCVCIDYSIISYLNPPVCEGAFLVKLLSGGSANFRVSPIIFKIQSTLQNMTLKMVSFYVILFDLVVFFVSKNTSSYKPLIS